MVRVRPGHPGRHPDAIPVNAISVRSLAKTFVRGFLRRKTVALRGIDLDVPEGVVFGFLGPNGAGKTTTIKILMGLLFPTAGSARIYGVPAGTRAAKAQVGYLPERPYFYEYLTARELLDLVGRLYGLDRSERSRRTERLLERVGMTHAADRPLRSYSKGMLQRVGLAQALLPETPLLVLDEPASGLDPIGRKDVRDIVLEEKRKGKTIFFSTHILADASTMCDRVAIIAGGRIRGVGSLDEMLERRIDRIDVVFSIPEEARPALADALPSAVRRTPEGDVASFSDHDAVQAFLRAVLAAGGEVHEVVPHRQTLEEIFVEKTASRAPAATEGGS
ncbi:MAG: ABC transporter ATP-binding protein [Deltaproteobacteria bacterium]|nr:MAG: ABC transporter ATP-binding protein [Deltaproteobacteria bacterium]